MSVNDGIDADLKSVVLCRVCRSADAALLSRDLKSATLRRASGTPFIGSSCPAAAAATSSPPAFVWFSFFALYVNLCFAVEFWSVGLLPSEPELTLSAAPSRLAVS